MIISLNLRKDYYETKLTQCKEGTPIYNKYKDELQAVLRALTECNNQPSVRA